MKDERIMNPGNVGNIGTTLAAGTAAGGRRLGSSFAVAFRMTLRSMPSMGSVPTTIVQIVAAPVFNTLFYMMLAWSGVLLADPSASTGAGPAIAALVGSGCVGVCTLVAETLANDRFEGTMPYMLLGGSSALVLWAGRIGAMLVVGVLSDLASLLAVMATVGPFALSWAHWLLVAALILVSSLACLGVGLLVAVASLAMSDELFLSNTVGYVLPLVCGVVAPVSVFPRPFAAVLYVLPLPWLTDAARDLAAGDEVRAGIGMGVAVAIGAAWGLLAVICRRLAMTINRRHDNVTGLGI